MKRELVYMDSKSSKFWSIELAGSSHTVTYGRIGTTGQSATKSFPSEEAARKDMEKLIREKLGKGYVDAAGSGVGAGAGGASTGATSGAGGLIPPVAFSHINRREDVGRNAGTFIGQRVVDYDPEKPVKTDVIYRFRSNWDEANIIPHLEHFLATNAAAEAVGIVIGAWHGDDPEKTPESVFEVLTKGRDRLPKLAALYVGDVTSEENEMSWIKQTDLSPLLQAFPKLQLLRSRGGDGLQLTAPRHDQLRALALETGGLDVSVIRSICTSQFPSLEYLELWLGTDEYGANHTVADLQPILSGRLFPKLKYLGLRNSHLADELAGVVVNSPILQQIETLDLSLGVLTDEAGSALLNLPASPTLKKLNLHYNYFSPEMVRKLKALPLTVDASKPSDMEDDDEWRFVAVGE
ncbi:MAG TPA: STM4015 family protein [Verrucomicrobiae bacterium]|nr:STM4015 family protein [Verrucomicrobiae bacterium]